MTTVDIRRVKQSYFRRRHPLRFAYLFARTLKGCTRFSSPQASIVSMVPVFHEKAFPKALLGGSDRAEARRRDHHERDEFWTQGAESVAVATFTDRARRDQDPALLRDRLQLSTGTAQPPVCRRAERPTATASFAICTRTSGSEREPSMRQVHRAGEKLFIDYSGKKPQIVDRETGEVIEVELFVAVLGAIELHVRGGDAHAAAGRLRRVRRARASNSSAACPRWSVPDQLRSAVSGPDRYDPEINPTYAGDGAALRDRRSCRRVRASRRTRRRSRGRCRWRSGGSWRASATGPSSASTS